MTPFAKTLVPHRLAAALLCSASLWQPAAAGAEVGPSADDGSIAALEARFWDCDYASTQTALSPHEGAQCVLLHDELKRRRFGGDFARLLAWWQAHKAEQHGLRAAASTTADDEVPRQHDAAEVAVEWPTP